MNIYEMLQALRLGRYCARPYMGHRCYLLLRGDTIIYSSNGYDAPWLPAHPDLLANDWVEVIPHP